MKSPCLPALLALSFLATAACSTKPPATMIEEQPKEGAINQEAKDEAKPAASKELTQEELDLLEADPKTLSPEQNRKRAYALRKKVMQNPDSPAARALEDARQAALAGQLNFDADGEPKDPADNGVVIPTPDYLRSDKPLGSKTESE